MSPDLSGDASGARLAWNYMQRRSTIRATSHKKDINSFPNSGLALKKKSKVIQIKISKIPSEEDDRGLMSKHLAQNYCKTSATDEGSNFTACITRHTHTPLKCGPKHTN